MIEYIAPGMILVLGSLIIPFLRGNVAKSVAPDDSDQNVERRAALKELAGDVRRFGAAKDDASALAYVSAALRDDLELYDLLAAKLDDDLRACDALVM